MEVLKIALFTLTISLLFPVFSFAFVNLSDEPTDYDIVVSQDLLGKAGIKLSAGESHNVTFNGGYVSYNLSNDTDNALRVEWKPWGVIPMDGFKIHEKTWLGKILNSDWFWSPVLLTNPITNEIGEGISNVSVIDYFNTDYNWTRYTILNLGYQVFFTYNATSYGSMDEAIGNGTVSVTIGKILNEGQGLDVWKFAEWYSGTLFGAQYAVPDFFNWIVRFMGLISLISMVVFIRALTKI